MAWEAYRAGGRIAEEPITFIERREGASKMSGADHRRVGRPAVAAGRRSPRQLVLVRKVLRGYDLGPVMQRERSPRPHSLSMFFPAYNDGGTIASLVIRAVQVATRLTPDFEVIVVNDGSTRRDRRDLRRAVAHVPAGAGRSITRGIADTAARCAPASRRPPSSWSRTPTATRSTTRPSSRCSGTG